MRKKHKVKLPPISAKVVKDRAQWEAASQNALKF